MNKFKTFLAWNYCARMRMWGWMFQQIPSEYFQKVGKVMQDEELIAAANCMQKNMTLLPALPGTKRFNHNLQYSQPYANLLRKKLQKAFS